MPENEPYYRSTGSGEKDPPTQFCPVKPTGPDPVTPPSDPEGSETQRHSQLYALDKSDGQFKPLCWKDGKLVVDTELSAEIDLGNISILELGTSVNEYDEAPAVAIGVVTTIVQFLVPPAKIFYFRHATFSGVNFGEFHLKVDADIKDTFRTHDGFGVSGRFDWRGDDATPGSLEVAAGKKVIVEVVHNGYVPGKFESRIYGRLVDV